MGETLLLPDDVRLEYLAEGAANIVYRILPGLPARDGSIQGRPNHVDAASAASSTSSNTTDLHSLPSETSTHASTPPPTEVEWPLPSTPVATASQLYGKLLRLHKDVPWIPSYTSLYNTFATNIAPLFDPSNIVSQSLILLPPHLITTCNTALQTAESASWLSQNHTAPTAQIVHSLPRPAPRHGLYISPADAYGLLIEDMSPSPLADSLLLELKPKWLVQSPNAPKDSTRCRTCALRALRGIVPTEPSHSAGITEAVAQEDKTATSIAGRSGMKPTFCPLDLVSDNKERVEAAVDNVLSATLVASHELQLRDPTIFSGLRSSLTDFFLSDPLLRRLRNLQQSLDPAGVLALLFPPSGPGGLQEGTLQEGKETNTNYLIATTLRDCTLFLRVTFLPPPAPPTRLQLEGQREALGAGPSQKVRRALEEMVSAGDSPNREGESTRKAEGEGGEGTRGGVEQHPKDIDDDETSLELEETTTEKSALHHQASHHQAPLTDASSTNPFQASASQASAASELPEQAEGTTRIEAKLGDLDLKEPEPEKVRYWAGLEGKLVEGGWYLGPGSTDGGGGERGGKGGKGGIAVRMGCALGG